MDLFKSLLKKTHLRRCSVGSAPHLPARKLRCSPPSRLASGSFSTGSKSFLAANWVLLALALSLFLESCSQSKPARPRGGPIGGSSNVGEASQIMSSMILSPQRKADIEQFRAAGASTELEASLHCTSQGSALVADPVAPKIEDDKMILEFNAPTGVTQSNGLSCYSKIYANRDLSVPLGASFSFSNISQNKTILFVSNASTVESGKLVVTFLVSYSKKSTPEAPSQFKVAEVSLIAGSANGGNSLTFDNLNLECIKNQTKHLHALISETEPLTVASVAKVFRAQDLTIDPRTATSCNVVATIAASNATYLSLPLTFEVDAADANKFRTNPTNPSSLSLVDPRLLGSAEDNASIIVAVEIEDRCTDGRVTIDPLTGGTCEEAVPVAGTRLDVFAQALEVLGLSSTIQKITRYEWTILDIPNPCNVEIELAISETQLNSFSVTSSTSTSPLLGNYEITGGQKKNDYWGDHYELTTGSQVKITVDHIRFNEESSERHVTISLTDPSNPFPLKLGKEFTPIAPRTVAEDCDDYKQMLEMMGQ